MTLAYLPQNSPPVVKSINVVMPGGPALAQASKAAAHPGLRRALHGHGHRYRRCIRASPAGTPTQTLPRASAQQLTITWQAEDPDGDRLVYNVYFRGDDESQWKLLKGNTHDNSLTFDSDIFADGKYFFRVAGLRQGSQPAAYGARGATDRAHRS